MNSALPQKASRIILGTAFGSILAVLIAYANALATLTTSESYAWLIGDWLINYGGGLIRRGLIGQVAVSLSALSGIPLITLVMLLQLSLYLIFLFCTWRLVVDKPLTPLTAALIFSPAFILFPILNPAGGFRKEILLFALLSATCLILSRRSQPTSGLLPMGIGPRALLLVLSHEMLVVFLPYLLCAIIIQDGGFSRRARQTTFSLIPAILLALVLGVFSKATPTAIQSICQALGQAAPIDCSLPVNGGAITFLGYDIVSAHTIVERSFFPSTAITYLITGLLSFAPIILAMRNSFIQERLPISARRWLATLITASLLASLLLLWVMADHGRMIYLHITCLSLLTLLVLPDHDRASVQVTAHGRVLLAWAGCLLFLIGWRLVHFGATLEKAFFWYASLIQ